MNNYDEIERKIFLIKNYLEDNLSVAEEEELRVWLDESPKHKGDKTKCDKLSYSA